ATNKGENSEPKNFFPNIVKCNISENISKKLILILTEIFTIDYGNLEMQQQIQRFLDEYFENPKSSNKETIKSNKPSVSNGNGTTTLKGKGILQEKDKTENLDHYEDITKPVMNLNKSGRTMYSKKEHIKKSVRIPSATHRPDKENIQPVGMQFNIKENPSNHTEHTEPNEKSIMDLLYNIMNRLEIIEKNLICLNEVLDQTWENIETAIIAAAKKTVSYLQVKKTVKAKRQKTAIAKAAIALGKLIREINKEEKKRLDLEGVAEARHAVLTHTDDTTWIASKLANEFYQLNGIKANGAKLKLVVLNAEKSNIEQAIQRKLASTRKWSTIISMLDSKSEKQSKQPHIDFGLFFVRQLLDRSEELLIDDAESCKVKEDFFSNDINTSALQPHCENVTSDNRRKQWIWFTQKNKKKWYLGRVTKVLEKSALIKHWTEMHVQGDKCRLLKYGGCNLNTKSKKNGCMISCNKNLIRGAAVGITKRENNWITNFLTTLLKDKPEYPLTPVQECPLFQLKKIDYTERELVKSQNFTEK
ncbi:31524_t:CDS:2, partial [Gigaspora margarita]